MQTLTTERIDRVPLDLDRDAESLHAMYADVINQLGLNLVDPWLPVD